jgi:broad specificity phosphatase PhoE
MTNKLFIILILVFGFQSCQIAQKSDLFTIYLVRHSEKDLASKNEADTPLTKCGKQRSESLSTFLNDVKLNAIYSTDYNRTLNTALPTANSKELKIIKYSPRDLVGLSKLLLDAKKDALVVGHSNTTGVLAGLLVGEEIGEIDLDIYDRIYQVVISEKNGRLHLLHSPFECKE